MNSELKVSGLSPKGVCSFPALLEAELNKLNGKVEYSVQLIIPKDEPLLERMKQHAANAATKKWGTAVPKNVRSPFRDGDTEREGNEDYAGKVFITFRSKHKPQVVDADLDEIIDKGAILPGDYGRVSYNTYAYSQAGNNGVSFGLNNFQYLGKGEPLKGINRTRAVDDFGDEDEQTTLSPEEVKKAADSLF